MHVRMIVMSFKLFQVAGKNSSSSNNNRKWSVRNLMDQIWFPIPLCQKFLLKQYAINSAQNVFTRVMQRL